METTATVVISDVHVGAEELDDCDATLEAEIVAFARHIGEQRRPIELVFNGDFLDFAQAPPIDGEELRGISAAGVHLCFTEAQSVQKFEAIYYAHYRVFEALAGFLAANQGNRIVIVPGNHDADFFWDGVRAGFLAKFEEALRPRIKFHLEQHYRPAHAPGLWIEHGHQHDPCNRFHIGNVPRWSEQEPPILPDAQGAPRLIECIGTRFMTRFLNRLDGMYPFVDNVKPLKRFLWLFFWSIGARQYAPLKARIALWWMCKYLWHTTWDNPRDLLASEPDGSGDPETSDGPDWLPSAAELVRSFERTLPDHGDRLLESLGEAGFVVDRPLVNYADSEEAARRLLAAIGDRLGVLDREDEHRDSVFGAGNPGTFSLTGGFCVDESSKLQEVADGIAAREAIDAIVMGHTHEFVDTKLARGVHYVNIGSWTRYLRKNDPMMTWDILRRGQDAHFPYRLIYAWYDTDATPRLDVRMFREAEVHGSR